MTREEAIKVVRNIYQTDAEKEALKTLIPELSESEDERIREELIEFIKWSVDRHFMMEKFHQSKKPSEWLSWLEKQKEYPTNEEMLRTLRVEYEKGVADTIAEQNLTEWSEKDEKMLKSVLGMIGFVYESDPHGYGLYAIDAEQWLKSLPNHLNLQPKTEWSEEATKVLDSIIDDYEKAAKSFCGYDGKIGLLRAIRDGECNLPKQEWSEYDEEYLDYILKYITKYDFNQDEMGTLEEYHKLHNGAVNWLKSIRPQPQ